MSFTGKEVKRALAAIERADDYKARGASHVPVFADMFLDREKIGHIVSDGYAQKTWSFYPVDRSGRMQRRDKPFDEVLPRWAEHAEAGPFQTSEEIREDAEEEKREAIASAPPDPLIVKTVKAVCREIASRADHLEASGSSGDHARSEANYAAAQAVREVADAISFALLGTEDYAAKEED